MKRLKYILLGALVVFSFVFCACGGTDDSSLESNDPLQSEADSGSVGDSSFNSNDSSDASDSSETSDSSDGGDSSSNDPSEEDVYAPNV